MIVTGAILLVAITFLWIGLLANLGTPNSSDAAGNGMARAFAILFVVAIWIMLAILMIMAGIKGQMPPWTMALAFILLPASGYAAGLAGELLAESDLEAKWLIVVPALLPPLLILFALWSYLPSWRASVPASIAGGVLWSAVLILSILPWPMRAIQVRNSAARMANERNKADDDQARFAKLTPESSLWEVTPFLDNYLLQAQALEHIRQSAGRQADAETMLDRGDFPLRHLLVLELNPTPQFCEKAHRFLAQREESLRLATPQSRSAITIASDLDAAINAMQWLGKNQCDCRDLGAAYLNTVHSYKDSNLVGWNLVQLREIGEGKR